MDEGAPAPFCWRRTVRTGETLSIFDHSRESLVLVKREQEGQFGKKTKLSQKSKNSLHCSRSNQALRKKTKSSAYI